MAKKSKTLYWFGCEKCQYVAPKNEERSTKNWNFYDSGPCPICGEDMQTVLGELPEEKEKVMNGETMPKNNDVRECGEMAIFSYYWPGKAEPSHVCEIHAMQAAQIAKGMGFVLAINRTPTSELSEQIVCKVEVRKNED